MRDLRIGNENYFQLLCRNNENGSRVDTISVIFRYHKWAINFFRFLLFLKKKKLGTSHILIHGLFFPFFFFLFISFQRANWMF